LLLLLSLSSLQSGSCVDTSTDDATSSAAAGLPSPNVIRTKNRESEAWYTHNDGGPAAESAPATTARPTGDPSSGPSTPSSGHRPGRNDEAKRLAMAAGGDPNDWYRHDHASNGVDGTAKPDM